MAHNLLSISPLDGRYADKVDYLSQYFSEAALMRYRILVEVEWFVFLFNDLKLKKTKELKPTELRILRSIYEQFDIVDAERVKEIEKVTNHDVKAVEIFLREKYTEILPETIDIGVLEWIHFGLTSQDVNHLAFIKIYKKYITQLIQEWETWTMTLTEIGQKWDVFDMLAHTHGQPATPTTLGHEMMVFVERWEIIIERLKSLY